jgi:tRNA(adenine34) deaminase
MTTRKAPAREPAKSPARKSHTKTTTKSITPPSHRWSAKITTDSTHPEHDLFNRNAETIAKSLASKKVSPKGPASGMRMLTFYINRAGKNLSATRHRELEKAKDILSGIIAKQTDKQPAKKSSTKKSAAKKSVAKKKSTHSKS